MDYYILAVNPGSTSTKLAVYENEKELFKVSVNHPAQELAFFENFYDQLSFRRDVVLDALTKNNFDVKRLSAVVGRGGMLPPIDVGGYTVNKKMIDYLLGLHQPPHASNLGCMIALEIAEPLNIPAYIYDAISACALPPEATITGFKEFRKSTFCHVLNSRAAAIRYAQGNGKTYGDISVVVAHLGGGISVSAHTGGKIAEVAGDDDGSFSPERSGGAPLIPVVNLCFDKKFTRNEILKKIRGEGGLKALLGTTDLIEVEKAVAAGDAEATLVYDAMVLQISKAIGSVSAAIRGNVEAVILTGGMAHSKMLTDKIKEYVSFIAPVEVFPGENELSALALGGFRILKGEETAREF